MGSEPQYAKWPLLSESQHVFTLTNPYASDAAQKAAAQALKDDISKHQMAPLYRHLAHPFEGILCVPAEGLAGSSVSASFSGPGGTSATTAAAAGTAAGGGAGSGGGGGSSGGSGPRRPLSRKSSMVGVMPASSEHMAWDEGLYQQLKEANDRELDGYQREEDEAVEKAGDTEIMAARGRRAEFWARVGDKDRAIAAYEDVFEKTGVLGTKIDIVLAIIRMGLFFGDKALVKKHVERAKTLVETGGDWDRRNRLKAYEGLHLLTVRAHAAAAPLLLDSLSTFTSYELCTYSSLVVYSVLAGSVSLKRVDFKSKVVDAPEIKAILGDGEDKLLALSGALSAGPGADDGAAATAATMAPSAASASASVASPSTATAAAGPGPAKTTPVVNLTALSGGGVGGGGGGADKSEVEIAVDFSPLALLVSSLYNGNYKAFFVSLARVEEQFLTQDRYLHEHRNWFIREMRLRAYQQLLRSYRVVGLDSMANDFGVTVEFLDRDLAKFIAAGRVPCTIDRVSGKGVIETNRPDDKNKQYQDVVRQGDQLITKLQKYGQAVRLRGSERA